MRNVILAGIAFSIFFPVRGVAETTLRIPLREGLTVVTAVRESAGDYESIKRITKADQSLVRIAYSVELPGNQKSTSRRTVRREDLRSAREYRQNFPGEADVTYPGTTAIGTSAAVLNDLKTKGQALFSTRTGTGVEGAVGGMLGGLLKDVQGMPGMDTPDMKEVDAYGKIAGTLRRVGTVRIPVIVNDRRVELTGIRAAGKLGDDQTDFVFLDDPENPLALRWQIGEDSLEIVKISFPTESAVQQMAEALAKAGRAEIYGIYFDFAKATLRPESDQVLRQIAAVLAQNGGWKLSIEGHTDSVGSAAANLELSRKRAEAVKRALVEKYKIDAQRLTIAGFGASRPKETNDTLAGRARNRRVELVRLGADGKPAVTQTSSAAPPPLTPASPRAATSGMGTAPQAPGGAANLPRPSGPGSTGGTSAVLFRDDFSDKKSGWEAYESDDEDSNYYSGAFKIRLRDGGISHVPLEGKTFQNGRFEIDVAKKSGAGLTYGGINLRYRDKDPAQDRFKAVGPMFYRFLVRDDGAFAADAVQYKGYGLKVPAFVVHPAVKKGNEVNHLRVDAIGDVFTFYVNGQKVASFREGSNREGIVQLEAGGEKGMLQVVYDNFTVSRP